MLPWIRFFIFLLGTISLLSPTPVSAERTRAKNSSRLSPSALARQKFEYLSVPGPSSKIYRQRHEAGYTHSLRFTEWICAHSKLRGLVDHYTLAGVRSENTIPDSWTCLSPLTRSIPNSLTTSSERHSSWDITASSEPPVDAKKTDTLSTCISILIQSVFQCKE